MSPFSNPEGELYNRPDSLPLFSEVPLVHPPRSPLSGVTPVECRTYSVEETAIITGLNKSTIYHLIARGFFHPLHGLRHKRLPKQEVDDYARGVRVQDTRHLGTSSSPSASACSWDGKKRRIRRRDGVTADPNQTGKAS